ncbi:MAG: UDP-N-acetylglucosamine 2-epimerase (hydrolyzing) [Balneolaceae bacterium]|nr:UDP-N-acetylglucosamine 2-epimerase (hydrolyzing) [Balneolaceae bacterium]
MKNIGVLTSSRADYGIYYPLLCELRDHPEFELKIIAFGTHLSPYHGFTVNQIEDDGFRVEYKINSLLLNDDENSLATGAALTALKFSDFWNINRDEFDIVFCLGDRFEMFGAVSSGIPYGVNFAHIHAGETTLGAIDNVYRHAITLASNMYFTSTEMYSKRVKAITGSDKGIVLSGALALDNIEKVNLYTPDQFKDTYNIDLNTPVILMTVHPETVLPENNYKHLEVLEKFIEYGINQARIVITMPNADTMGSLYRELYQKLENQYPKRIKIIENFGTKGYFTCLKHCKMVVGNSSSGIIEAASFGKYVINIGDRQKGRFTEANVKHVPFKLEEIKKAFGDIWQSDHYDGFNPYYHGGAANKILIELKKYFNIT